MEPPPISYPPSSLLTNFFVSFFLFLLRVRQFARPALRSYKSRQPLEPGPQSSANRTPVPTSPFIPPPSIPPHPSAHHLFESQNKTKKLTKSVVVQPTESHSNSLLFPKVIFSKFFFKNNKKKKENPVQKNEIVSVQFPLILVRAVLFESFPFATSSKSP